MNTYFLKFRVVPTNENSEHDRIESGLALCWVVVDNPEDAISIASFYVSRYDWTIKEIEQYPIETNRKDFIGKDGGLKCYDKDQEDGIEIIFVAKSRDASFACLAPSRTSNSFVQQFLLTIRLI
jgi:hypothetical protein